MGRRFVGLLSLMIALSGASAYAQAADSAVVTTSTFGQVRSIRRLRSEQDFINAYRGNDSAIALIKFYFRRRSVGIVATSVGTISIVAGTVGYVSNAVENVAGSLFSAISGGVLRPEQPAVNGSTHVLFFGGLTLTAIGGNEWHRFTRRRLQSALNNPNQLTTAQWSRILRSTAEASTAPSALPSAKEQDEALRQQQEYWRKKGRTPPAPKQ
jgi:hypothetical protein